MARVEQQGPRVRIHEACSASVDVLAAFGGQVLSAGAHTARLWPATAGPDDGVTMLAQWPGGRVVAIGAALNGGVVVGRGYLDEVWRWDAHTGQSIGVPIGHRYLSGSVLSETPPLAVTDTAAGPVIVTDFAVACLQRWDARSGAPIGVPWKAHEGGVWAIAASALADGTPCVISGGTDGLVRRWEVATGTEIGSPIEGCGQAVAIASTSLADGRVIACVASSRGFIHRRDLATGEKIGRAIATGWQPRPLEPANPTKLAVISAGDGGVIASCVDGHVVQLWDLFTGEPIAEGIDLGGLAV